MDCGCFILKDGSMQTAELNQALSDAVRHDVVVLNQRE
jgi:hypothetical protein